MNTMHKLLLPALLLATLPFLGTAQAGPPCACWPVEVGDAPTLDTKDKQPKAIAAEALRLLRPDLPVLARMEVLRRAAISTQGDAVLAERMIGTLCARVLDVETGKAQHPERAWFDAGYAVACFRQTGMVNRMGYDWIAKAIELAPAEDKGPMHYAAALAVLMPHPRHTQFVAHVRAARKAAAHDALLLKNFQSFEKQYPQVLRHFEKEHAVHAKKRSK